MFGAVLRWGGVGSGPDKGGEIDLIMLCVDVDGSTWAVDGPTCKTTGLQSAAFCTALVYAYAGCWGDA